ncbi:synaptotagmin-3-like isoform X2 [Punica granatum]|uniref:Synaptotagmin-3-like isoform X2 n=1 Tax=Punica granatum TaxID=22663 RepID=A0A6P8C9S9_PUNGR|nr:synaptotagmin-3-like isoform X2 [Punica granatum]
MELLGRLLEIIGFGIGIPIGLLLGYYLFIHPEPRDVKDPIIRPIHELDTSSLLDLWPEVPLWAKHPDCDRTDWLNKFLSDMWPYLDKAICNMIRSTAEPMFAEYIGKYQIKSVYFDSLTLGTLPPTFHGIKVHESNENELVLEPAVRWAGNPNITLVLKVLSLQIKLQLVDVQVFAAPRIVFKPLVPTFPCFSSIAVSLLEKPQIDFGLNLMKADVMAIPGLYHYVQETIRKQVAGFYLWPQTLEIPILDSSVGATKKPVGILHVKVVRAIELLKMDFLGASDPYVKLSLSGERIPAKRTSVKMRTLNPVWNENFKLTVKDLQSQVLELRVYDWEKIGPHDKLGMQVVPLRLLSPHEAKEFTLDLFKNQNPNDPHNKRRRGKVVVELRFDPFKEDHERFSGPLEVHVSNQSRVPSISEDEHFAASGLLLITVIGAQDVEGKRHNNPCAVALFGGERKRTKTVKKTQDPCWNEEFQFVLDEASLKEVIRIEVISKRRKFGFQSKESLGYVDIQLFDVVHNEHINDKFHLINSRNGIVHVDMRWRVI